MGETIKLTEQQRRVKDYLDSGRTLTNIVAITCLGVGSLSSRVSELRGMGVEINTELDTESDPHGRAFKKYTIAAAKSE